ncbi:MAG: hypothetical protein J5802_09715 [Butyrivibrio sp.]|nr:hypothetical protein [Butyrivibrio sp.]
MRKIIDRKTAYRAVLLIIALVAILSVWPFRIWTSVTETSSRGEKLEERSVNWDHLYSQKFVARYDRLSSLDIYISKMEKGRYIEISLFDENGIAKIKAQHDAPEGYEGEGVNEVLKVQFDTDGFDIPGYVRVPLEYNVEVGKEYMFYVQGCRSKFNIELESVPDNSEYVGSMYENDSEVPGKHIIAGYNYRVPVSKKISFCIIAAIAVLTAALYGVIGLWFSKHPGSNTLVTVEKCIKYTANPIAAIVYLTLMVMVFPLKLFDMRAADIIFYEIGLIVAAAITLYAINHKSVKSEVGISYIDKINAGEKVRYFCIMFSMAMVIWNSCNYMNAFYSIYQQLAERKMAIWLLAMILLTFTAGEAFNALNLVWLIASTIGGIRYYMIHLIPDTEKEFDLKNAALKYAIIIVILSGFVAINLIKRIFGYIQERIHKNISVTEDRVKVSAFGIFVYLFFILLVIMRNNSWWGVALAAIYSCLYIRGLVWKGRKDWLYIFSGGLMLNFVISLCYCVLYRIFAGYVSGRYGFLFHTVTIAGEYFIFMGAAITVLLTAKIVALPKGTGAKEIIKTSWKEMVLFGWIASYAIFTVTRTAYIAIFVCLFGILLVVLVCHGNKFGKILLTMILSIVVCFPAAFTLQRMVPAMVGDPAFHLDPTDGRDIDATDTFIRGGAAWGNPNYMCVERFINLFESKIFGIDVGDYKFPVDINNYDPKTEKPYFDLYGNPYEGSDEEAESEGASGDDYEEESSGRAVPCDSDNLLASARLTRAETLLLLDALEEHIDESNKWDIVLNGRVTIWNLYMHNLNMTGHEDQPTWPSGEYLYHAHSSYIQMAYDYGIPVGIMFLLFIIGSIVFGLIYYRKNEKMQPLALMPFAIVCGVMVAGMTESVFQFAYIMTPVMMFAIFPLMQNNE